MAILIDYWDMVNDTHLYETSKRFAERLNVPIEIKYPKRAWYRVVIWANENEDIAYREFKTFSEAKEYARFTLKSDSGQYADIHLVHYLKEYGATETIDEWTFAKANERLIEQY